MKEGPKTMEVHFTPELEKKLTELAAQSGRGLHELVQDVMAGYADEFAETRQMLDSRYDEIKNGKVKLIDGEEAFGRLRERIDARRNSPA
jgi:predicted DNA-binding protein